MDSIFIKKLVLFGKHGVGERERAKSQEFVVDISAEIDTKVAAKSDDIADTANYKEFADAAREVIEGSSCHLIETLARRITRKILDDKKIKRVSVTIRKPRAVSAGMAGVTVVRAQY